MKDNIHAVTLSARVQLAPAPKIVGLQRAEVLVHPKFSRTSRHHPHTTLSSWYKSSLKKVWMFTIFGKSDKAYRLPLTPTNASENQPVYQHHIVSQVYDITITLNNKENLWS